MNKKELSKVMSALGKLSHKKSPRTKEFYQKMALKSHENRLKKLSTGKDKNILDLP